MDADTPKANTAEVRSYEVFEGESVYRCSLCGGLYKRTSQSRTIGCLVNHGENDCCHLGEEVLENPRWRFEKVLLEKEK